LLRIVRRVAGPRPGAALLQTVRVLGEPTLERPTSPRRKSRHRPTLAPTRGASADPFAQLPVWRIRQAAESSQSPDLSPLPRLFVPITKLADQESAPRLPVDQPTHRLNRFAALGQSQTGRGGCGATGDTPVCSSSVLGGPIMKMWTIPSLRSSFVFPGGQPGVSTLGSPVVSFTT
jgi:hypothetical protein